MKAAFVLLLIAMLILPAAITVRVMVDRERRRLRKERTAAPSKPDEPPTGT